MAYIISILIGVPITLANGITYALPARRTLCRVQQAGGTIECSNDNSTWAAITLDDDESFEAGATFIRAVTTDAIVSCKAA